MRATVSFRPIGMAAEANFRHSSIGCHLLPRPRARTFAPLSTISRYISAAVAVGPSTRPSYTGAQISNVNGDLLMADCSSRKPLSARSAENSSRVRSLPPPNVTSIDISRK